MSRDTIGLTFDEIEIGDGRRLVDRDAVKRIAASIKEIGLQHPITVRSIKGRFHLVAGRHRLEAVRLLGHETVKAVVVSLDNIDARRWEIAENLHRAELTVQERDDQIAEWVRLTEEKRKVSQVATPGGKQPKNEGIRAASRELGIDKDAVHRAVKIASISEEAKEAVREAGLADNQSALLKVARAEPERQVAVVHQLVHQKAASEPLNDLEANERQVAKLMTAWNAASPDARQEFLLRIEQPVMDRRYGMGV